MKALPVILALGVGAGLTFLVVKLTKADEPKAENVPVKPPTVPTTVTIDPGQIWTANGIVQITNESTYDKNLAAAAAWKVLADLGLAPIDGSWSDGIPGAFTVGFTAIRSVTFDPAIPVPLNAPGAGTMVLMNVTRAPANPFS